MDAAQVLNTASSYGEQLELPLSGKKPIMLSMDLVTEMLAVTGSFRHAAKLIGVDVSTLMAAAETYDIPVKRRPKKVSAEMRDKIAQEPGDVATSVLAAQYEISVTTINRIRRGNRSKGSQLQLYGV